MKTIKKNNLYHALLLVLLSLGMGISYASEIAPNSISTASVVAEQKTSSLGSLIKSMAIYNISQSLSAGIADSYRDTIFHPAAFVGGKVVCSFIRNVYDKYSSGKLFNTGWKALIPEDITSTVHTYSKNPLLAPVMIACALGPVWSNYVGISPIFPALFGTILWATAEK